MKNSKSFFEKDYLELGCSGSSEPQDVLSQILIIIIFFLPDTFLHCFVVVL